VLSVVGHFNPAYSYKCRRRQIRNPTRNLAGVLTHRRGGGPLSRGPLQPGILIRVTLTPNPAPETFQVSSPIGEAVTLSVVGHFNPAYAYECRFGYQARAVQASPASLPPASCADGVCGKLECSTPFWPHGHKAAVMTVWEFRVGWLPVWVRACPLLQVKP